MRRGPGARDAIFSALICGREVRLYLLFEHQSTAHPLMPFRVLAYIVRIWEAWIGEHPGARRLPPVVPLVLAQVDGGWSAATQLLDLIDFGTDRERVLLGPLMPQCRVLIDDLAHLSDSALDARTMPAAAKLMLAALRDVRGAADMSAALASWARWLGPVARNTADASALSTLMQYILYVRPKESVEALVETARSIETSAGETMMTTARQLIEQGEARGEARGRATMLLKQLALRFDTVPQDVRARIEASDTDTLDRWAERVLTAKTLEELLAD